MPVGSVVSATEEPFGTNEAAVPSGTATSVSSVATTVSCFGSDAGPSFARSSKEIVSEAVAVPSASGAWATNSTVAFAPLASLPSTQVGWPATEQVPTLVLAETSTIPALRSTSAVACVADGFPSFEMCET